MFSGAEILPHSQWNLGDFFPNFLKLPIFKKKIFFFLGGGGGGGELGFYSVNTHMVTFSFNLITLVCI